MERSCERMLTPSGSVSGTRTGRHDRSMARFQAPRPGAVPAPPRPVRQDRGGRVGRCRLECRRRAGPDAEVAPQFWGRAEGQAGGHWWQRAAKRSLGTGVANVASRATSRRWSTSTTSTTTPRICCDGPRPRGRAGERDAPGDGGTALDGDNSEAARAADGRGGIDVVVPLAAGPSPRVACYDSPLDNMLSATGSAYLSAASALPGVSTIVSLPPRNSLV